MYINTKKCSVPGGSEAAEIHLHNFINTKTNKQIHKYVHKYTNTTNTQNGHQSVPGGDAVESKDEEGASPARPG